MHLQWPCVVGSWTATLPSFATCPTQGRLLGSDALGIFTSDLGKTEHQSPERLFVPLRSHSKRGAGSGLMAPSPGVITPSWTAAKAFCGCSRLGKVPSDCNREREPVLKC